MTVREMVALSVEAGNHENQSFAKVVEDFENKLAQRSETSSTIELKGERTVSWSPRALEDGGAVVIFEDVTERLSAESQSQYLSTHDSLTGLPNRILFDRMLEQTIKMARRYEKRFCVMFLDLDRFKAINDTLGHAAGDVMLQEVATRLRTNLRESNVVARLGGDEFVMIIQEVGNASQAETVAQKIVENIARPLTIQGQECATGASIGIAMFPVDASDEKSLIKCADAAMYRAKEEGKNRFQFFSSGAAVPSLRSLKFESDLRHALEREEFVLLYQPKKDIATGAIAGVEAQLRWSHPESGILASDSFLQLAEETGLMISIGKWALETACRQNVAWSREGIENLRVAVDISQRQLLSRDLLGDIEAALSSSGMSAELLELEISESALLRDHERSDDLLQSMRRAGMRVTIDDFGAGYSSLSRLKELPVDAIKIDRSVIQGLLVDQRDQAIVQAIITMARALGLTTVADGVETRGQEAFLKAHACDQMQGSLSRGRSPATRSEPSRGTMSCAGCSSGSGTTRRPRLQWRFVSEQGIE